MKILIIAINAKYMHSSLAPWYLKAACRLTAACSRKATCNNENTINILDFTINMQSEQTLATIYNNKPDILAFSCYIFNIEMVFKICSEIKKLMPQLKIILGGPEVSFDAIELMKNHKEIDFIISGEGEQPFSQLIDFISDNKNTTCDIAGVTYRNGCDIKQNSANNIQCDLSSLPSPYTDEMLEAAKNKIAYFEASRGCPFKCSYCLSSESGGVRFFELERVKSDLFKLMHSEVRQIKFVDRTFNCNINRAKEIFSYIINNAQNDLSGKCISKNYHFEMAADIFDEQLLSLLSTAPQGLFQFEIGIQSMNEATLQAVNRKTNIEICCNNIKRLLAEDNIHIHLDLIAGLPYEDYASFVSSFNGIYALRPHTIQLGFLKLLKGSNMREYADKNNYIYTNSPPYEILKTPHLSFDEILRLKNIENAVERLYNSGKFNLSTDFIIKRFSSPFCFYEKFSLYLSDQNFYEKSISLKEYYNLFYNFAKGILNTDEMYIFNELIKYDYFISDNSSHPPALIKRTVDPQIKSLYKSMKKNILFHLETFMFDIMTYVKTGVLTNDPVVLRFCYNEKNGVSGKYICKKIDLELNPIGQP
jgi:radical SAM superfamily enzyme YgiQ (UPF0313 family)